MSGARTGKALQPIENYGVIGNMRSIALVSVEGSIDFLCYPKVDSPSIFAALLDAERGGSFALNPDLEAMRVKQLYLPNTNILLTRFLSESGVAEVTDFMPVEQRKDKGTQQYGNHIIRYAARHQGAGALRDALRPAIRLRPIGPQGARVGSLLPSVSSRSARIARASRCTQRFLCASMAATWKASFTLNYG